MLDPKKKQLIIKKFKTHDEDTGSPQVQIAILSEEIKELTDHLKTHKKDFSSRRGLFRKVNLRRKLLQYLAKTEEKEYEKLIQALKIKRKIDVPGLTDVDEEKPVPDKKKDQASKQTPKQTPLKITINN